MVYEIFIPSKPCYFYSNKGLKSPMLSATLIRNKYFLHIINEIINIAGSLKNLVYTYKYKKKIITSILIIILNEKA